jgi:hypothetical protein
MVDKIRLNKLLPSLSPARKVKPADPEKRNLRQSPFGEGFERKRGKKKKVVFEPDKSPGSDNLSSAVSHHSLEGGKSDKRARQSSVSSQCRLIDIRV